MQQITLAEASQNLPDLIEAALGGEEIIIIKDNQPLVKLTPVSSLKHRRQPGSAKGLITISDDFDAPLEEFKEYME
ncbi:MULTISPECIES: type II toxin-antitoxin system prevent-host-death family antitoxin [unclassified Nostoc]|uniref:type II toxin-antitoxin system Phd/YefM family antitoxin n=1 Tax=unclassified Nostoc TaxID=2593658 RepID=UPI002AD25C82|nr:MULTISPECIES: type II toxin-antitoxin system prevent-host-death family antitoxin [unclassified Nostoc]MDZ8120932.1 type II toxin-antitoxin system prevent-host-death family antitoxin [Nostoc sp. CmiVER01]MDZ8223652.1 type II toxin-antitoxin system prevent-host-death family antitoxin [Nostoc sp. ChiVER01]